MRKLQIHTVSTCPVWLDGAGEKYFSFPELWFTQRHVSVSVDPPFPGDWCRYRLPSFPFEDDMWGLLRKEDTHLWLIRMAMYRLPTFPGAECSFGAHRVLHQDARRGLALLNAEMDRLPGHYQIQYLVEYKDMYEWDVDAGVVAERVLHMPEHIVFDCNPTDLAARLFQMWTQARFPFLSHGDANIVAAETMAAFGF